MNMGFKCHRSVSKCFKWTAS